jgi:UDP-N-acetylglucosamine/UDP-N-acetylgalactosamine diphosphorylase
MKGIRDQLAALGQDHVLRRLAEIPREAGDRLLEPLSGLNLSTLQAAAMTGDNDVSTPLDPALVRPPTLVEAPTNLSSSQHEEARLCGEELLSRGRVGILLVAGGMGTRLGWDQPKGTFPIGPVTSRTLFELFFQSIAHLETLHGVLPPLAIQTSPTNDEATNVFLEEHHHFGIPKERVRTFRQGTLPAWTQEGLLALNSSDRLVLLPDGHGGVYQAFTRNRVGEWMREMGVDHVFYFQVDNALVPMADPTFMGHHVLSGSQMSTMVIEKKLPNERVGVLAHVEESLRILEYSEIDEELAAAREDSGALRLRAANTGTHAFTLEFLERMGHESALPLHTAFKPIPHGEGLVPGCKMERFVFDALPLARTPLVYEALRSEVFAPVKSAEGADTPDAARDALRALYRRKCEEAGEVIPPGTPLELCPETLSDPHAIRRVVAAWKSGEPLVG